MRKPNEASLPDFRIFETDEFAKQLSRIPANEARLIRKKLQAIGYPRLRKQPYFGKNIRKLRGYEPDTWRYRIGRYRLFYEIDDSESIIYMLTLDQRKDAY